MSYWNYRVFRDIDDEGRERYSIVEVHYNKDDSVFGWAISAPLEWETYHDLKGTVKDLLPLAFNCPILVRKSVGSDELVEAPPALQQVKE